MDKLISEKLKYPRNLPVESLQNIKLYLVISDKLGNAKQPIVKWTNFRAEHNKPTLDIVPFRNKQEAIRHFISAEFSFMDPFAGNAL